MRGPLVQLWFEGALQGRHHITGIRHEGHERNMFDSIAIVNPSLGTIPLNPKYDQDADQMHFQQVQLLIPSITSCDFRHSDSKRSKPA